LRGRGPVEPLGHESVDVVIDVVGGGQFVQLLEILREVDAMPSLAPYRANRRSRPAHAISQGSSAAWLHGVEPMVFRNLVGYIERGEIRPLVAKIFALSAIVAAQREFSAKNHAGKIVLQP